MGSSRGIDIRAWAAKAARIVLVFMLVFWGAFRVEYLVAYGAVVSGSAQGHEDDTLADVDIYQLDREDPSKLGAYVTSCVDAPEGLSKSTPAISSAGGTASFVACPEWLSGAEESGADAVAADFVEWSVSDESVASLTRENGVVTLAGKTPGVVSVTCGLQPGLAFALGEGFDKARFDLEVRSPYISSLEILSADGAEAISDSTLALDEGDTAEGFCEYTFRARVRVNDGVDDALLHEYESSEGSLSAVSEGLLEDFSWSVFDESGSSDAGDAVIDDAGTLRIPVGETVVVKCSTGMGESVSSAEVTVVAGEPSGEDADSIQGASHPQDSLRIVGMLPLSSDVDGDSSDPTAGEATDGGQGAEGGPDAAVGEGSQADHNATADEASDSDSNEGEGSSPPAGMQEIDKSYSAEELESLGSSKGVFSVNSTAGTLTVTGMGPSLSAVLVDAGVVDTSAIESVDFVDYSGHVVTVGWKSLMGSASWTDATQAESAAHEANGPLVAISSYVHEASDGANPADDEKLVDNTRFRMLVNGGLSGADAASLCWINEIRLNAKGSQAEESDVGVRVEYVPVPLGMTAVFSAIPSTTIGSARFDFHWQESLDGGKTWQDVPNSSVQTLRKVTDEAYIGRQYRVILDTDIPGSEEGSFVSATSEAVTLEVGDGFVVTLAYDPPLAGTTALFQSSILGINEGDIAEYVWEETRDGGASWQVIPGKNGPSLAIPTEPVSAGSSGAGSSEDSGGGVNLIYIRVRAVAVDSRVAVSNAQPLTVRVDGSDSSGSGDEGGSASDAPGSETDSDAPGEGGGGAGSVSTGGSPSGVASITVERPVAADAPSDEPAQAPQNEQAASERILIDPEVTEKVHEQQEAVADYLNAAQPGARWTSLSTVQPTNDDVRSILSKNPFAPFAMPLALGVTAAGALEKALAFRRQVN